MSGELPTSVVIREVGPRDGLQAEPPVPPSSRARMVKVLLAAGIGRIEAVSFVSPRALPAMAGAEKVLEEVGRPPGVTITALVPNLRGAELALDATVDELTVTIAVSAAYNERNVKMTIAESLEAIASICSLASGADVPVDAVVSCAFGSPYEGDIGEKEVSPVLKRLRDAGVSAVTLADTTGMATPRLVSSVVEGARRVFEGTDASIGLHMHETRGTGLVNCYAAMQAGISRFDTSVGGLGGSPFADQAAGNVSTEDLVALLDDMAIESGIDLGRLLEASAVTEEIVGHRLQSKVAYAGPRLALR